MPLHSMVQSRVASSQLTFPGQLLLPVQRSWQVSASHRTSLMQEPCFSQVTSQTLPAHWTLPAQALSPLQLTLQLEAAPQSTPLGQAFCETHETSHGTPAGHATSSLQGCSASQVTTQTLPAHSPMPRQASAQSSGVATRSPPPAPLVPPPLVPLPPPLVPLPPPAVTLARPPLLFPPLPARLAAPAAASEPEPPSESNKSVGAGPAQDVPAPSRASATA
jgi:hypothetical protein